MESKLFSSKDTLTANRKVVLLILRSLTIGLRMAVRAVPENGMAQVAQMPSDLMPAALLRPCQHQADAGSRWSRLGLARHEAQERRRVFRRALLVGAVHRTREREPAPVLEIVSSQDAFP